jgi:hypothetical protein
VLDVNKENVALVIPGGGIIDFLRTFLEVPEESEITDASLCDVTSAKPEFLPDVDGDYVVELTVSNGMLTGVAVVTITSSTTSVAPNANTGSDQNALTGVIVYLDGSKSDDPDKVKKETVLLNRIGQIQPKSKHNIVQLICGQLLNGVVSRCNL